MRRNQKLFNRLATLIEDSPSYWDQSRWVDPQATSQVTQPRCLASLVAAFTGASAHPQTGGLVKPMGSVRVSKPELCDLHLVSDSGYILLYDYARVMLGLTREEADKLFDPDLQLGGDISHYLRRIGGSNEVVL